MTTERDRVFCRELAERIYANHVRNGRKGCDANHIAKNISYRESLYRGLLTECAFGVMFGLPVNREILDHGDSGLDFSLPLAIGRFPVNVKCKSVQTSWIGLMKSGTHLRVPISEIRPATIYVFGIYFEMTDDAEVLRWAWGQTLIRENNRAVFENGDGSQCYIKLFEELRELQELKDSML